MAKAIGKDPTKNTYELLLQPDLLEFEEAPKIKGKKNDASAATGSDPAKPPGYIPTPAEKELERKKKEEEQKKLAAEKEAINAAKKKKAENEPATGKKQPEKLSREQWEQQNKQQKKLQQSNPTGNQQVGQSDDGFQPARPKQQQLQQQPLQQSGQGQPVPDGANRGGRRNFQGGRGGRGGDGQGQNYQGGRGGGEGGQGGRRGNYRGEGQGQPGEGGQVRRGDGQGGNYRGGRGGEGRRGGRRGGRVNFEGEPAARLEENKNRDVNQRGQDLTQDRPPRKRQNDRKSGRHVTQHKTVANNNNTGELQIQVEGDWSTNAAPPLDVSVDATTGGEGWGDEGKGTANTTTEAPEEAKTEGAATEGAEQTGDAKKEKEAPTKGFDDFLKEQKDKKKQLAELLANNNISTDRPAPRVVEKDESGGKYFEINKLQDTHVTKKKEKEKEEPKKKEEKAKPQEKPEVKKELQYKLQFFNFDAPRGARRFNENDSDFFAEKPEQRERKPKKEQSGDQQPGQENTNQEGQAETKENAAPAPDTNADNGGDNNNQQQQRDGGNRPRGQRRGQGERQGGQGERRDRGERQGGQGERRDRGERQGGERQGGERQGGQGGRGGGRGRGRRFDSSSRGGNSNRGSGGRIATGPEHWPELV